MKHAHTRRVWIVLGLVVMLTLWVGANEPRAELYHLTDLGTLGGTTYARDINNAGQVVGGSYTSAADTYTHAFLYSNGTMTDLGTLGGLDSVATGINDAGQVVGEAFTAGNAAQHAFLYNNGTMTDLGTLGGTYSIALGLNSAGQAVGLSKTAGDAAEHAFVYQNGVLNDLNSLLDATGTGWTLTSAWAINNKGQIVGKGLNALGQQGAFLLTRVNRPPTCGTAGAFPPALWSPNHQFVPIVVTGVTDPEGKAVTITVTGVTQDEPVNGKGDGNTSPDAVIQAGSASVRAERSGKGNGRVYQLAFTADDGEGGVCTGAVTVAVPHSLAVGATAIDDGQIYNSTQP